MNTNDVTKPEPLAPDELYVTPRQRPPSEAKKRKQALREKSHRLHVFVGKPGTISKIGDVEYVIGPRGNIQRTSGQNQKDHKPTKRGGRGR